MSGSFELPYRERRARVFVSQEFRSQFKGTRIAPQLAKLIANEFSSPGSASRGPTTSESWFISQSVCDPSFHLLRGLSHDGALVLLNYQEPKSDNRKLL